ncbi:MAG: hypothetical protein UX85_C0011G0010 [Candidatus Beckwithbacteria bacterium GW2011_GWB1_47_15]|uniref:YopX protein domain-containing protein n=1 Tax=Candidatus Beckwithbacteria bacterium GW2011_GWB1_47_15 TaxID=1618371 RepID=A0A0G1URU1_9BACT|nr:MAG: hypothetical protein UY43_C0001G0476 [Candidatus Beckwithbacteria bacterium GW2011_GWC1_49_16]KKU34689.1 MAG: hypothetical protein UX50_C0014G0010 [Candidatus Beckwithbacteria bacterium GW2011_GWA1_46_30]KKU60435.1 MAG: hypothetical protein UX85_C0011G0010 [Candidatus Beckwithbacteria bacterium GW2011_GWB1_47_15]KKU71618.1 MAG: hypothetical protein UX97_C0005G0101 [Candidatus Beckwithbacteria bacterium GW2011_GWA2_47_25]OGD48196.1 MAG: hypothetical protein A2877_02900 [Candidatus Beckwi
MTKDFTNYCDDSGQKIYVGDLVTLASPLKNEIDKINIFKVVKGKNDYEIVFYKGSMSSTDRNYRQKLSGAYKVIGNIKTGIDESLLE